MAKKKKADDFPASVEKKFQESVNWAERFYDKNGKTVNAVGIILILMVGGYFGFKYLYQKPREDKAVAMMFKAQHYFAIDSFRLALEGDGNNYGFLKVIDRYGNTKAGNQARYSAGVSYVHLGEYQKGIDYLKKFNANDKIVQGISYGIMGDAYMELGNNKEGIKQYKRAAEYDDNDLISPLYLMRAAQALEMEGDTKEALTLYKKVKNQYPTSAQAQDIDKYLARLGATN